MYDLHRQRILERHGFVFHRIWSTNWWRNPNREKIQLLNFIKNTINNRSSVEDTAINLKSAFSDDAHNISHSTEQGTVMHRQDIAPLEGTVVEVGSKVTIKYMNTGQEISVHIVDTQNNEAVKGMTQKIYWKSPLASSLLRRREGDIVKLGRLDNFVEVIAIVNDEDKSVGLETEQSVRIQNSI